MRYEALDDCEVVNTTDKAIQIAWEDERGELHERWLPRSMCEDGDTLDLGDTDISVAYWLCIKEDLPT